ncbi:hypothetical protein MOZ60_04070, partial [Stecheria sp. CLA-KB-P133]|nr:hypothetical protein [Stecheria sp. CLA-KB-P133]
ESIIRKITKDSEVFSFLTGDIIKSRSVTINLICEWSFRERRNMLSSVIDDVSGFFIWSDP